MSFVSSPLGLVICVRFAVIQERYFGSRIRSLEAGLMDAVGVSWGFVRLG